MPGHPAPSCDKHKCIANLSLGRPLLRTTLFMIGNLLTSVEYKISRYVGQQTGGMHIPKMLGNALEVNVTYC